MAGLRVSFVERSVAKKLANLRLRGEPSLPAFKAESARGGGGGGIDSGKSWRAREMKNIAVTMLGSWSFGKGLVVWRMILPRVLLNLARLRSCNDNYSSLWR